MEKKTKHRILGVLVVIGLVIIFLPFLQTNKELPSEKMLVKAPPFPDQSTQLMQDGVTSDELETTASLQSSTKTPSLSPQENTANQQPDDTIKPSVPSTVGHAPIAIKPDISQKSSLTNEPTISSAEHSRSNENKKLAEAASSKDQSSDQLTPDEADEDETAIANKKSNDNSVTHPVSSIAKTTKKNISSTHPRTTTKLAFVPKIIEYKSLVEPLTSDGLSRLKNSAWVIQLGSFQNKSHAVRLVNQLRAKGYPAFIQQVSTSMGSTTQVYVGPEMKQDHARVMADRIASALRIHGIVISYKPLTL